MTAAFSVQSKELRSREIILFARISVDRSKTSNVVANPLAIRTKLFVRTIFEDRRGRGAKSEERGHGVSRRSMESVLLPCNQTREKP